MFSETEHTLLQYGNKLLLLTTLNKCAQIDSDKKKRQKRQTVASFKLWHMISTKIIWKTLS
jgi:hypothetical protein